ncbi:Hypothetical protein CulFRC11_0782 [Corynebacterium ramonii]|uniref:Uncharacterized protein n=1 Tax=Corynebacterium ramonii TaxID=3026968 RepID=A0ABM5RQY3_9CORY|nr:Hypothetical protein CulFRC11_0782 [Corynebacterium ramonii FRC0011]ESU58650.1 hypothetical protein D881_04980 [Corynebacterium ulcerans NCTC 12077]
MPATPEEFQANALTHEEFVALQSNPPEWLQELRRTGPHPRPVVAQKLGVTITALKRNDMDKALTTAEIKALLENQPEWLRAARTTLANSRNESTNNATSSNEDNNNRD